MIRLGEQALAVFTTRSNVLLQRSATFWLFPPRPERMLRCRIAPPLAKLASSLELKLLNLKLRERKYLQ